LAKVRVEVHEEDIHEVLVLDVFTSDGHEALPSSLEGLDVEVNRLGRIMEGGVELSSGINPGGNVGGFKSGLECGPEPSRTLLGGRLEEGPVLWVNSEIDGNSCLAVSLLPYCCICCLVLPFSPKHNGIQALHGKQHFHLRFPGEPVVGGEEGDLGEEVVEEAVGGHADRVIGHRDEVEQWMVMVVEGTEEWDQKSKKADIRELSKSDEKCSWRLKRALRGSKSRDLDAHSSAKKSAHIGSKLVQENPKYSENCREEAF
jgi:hypothetical protein